MSIIDGMYWEEQRRVQIDNSKTETLKESLQKEFNKLMPCGECKINEMCKYVNSIKYVDYNKDIFNIEIKCNKIIKEKI